MNTFTIIAIIIIVLLIAIFLISREKVHKIPEGFSTFADSQSFGFEKPVSTGDSTGVKEIHTISGFQGINALFPIANNVYFPFATMIAVDNDITGPPPVTGQEAAGKTFDEGNIGYAEPVVPTNAQNDAPHGPNVNINTVKTLLNVMPFEVLRPRTSYYYPLFFDPPSGNLTEAGVNAKGRFFTPFTGTTNKIDLNDWYGAIKPKTVIKPISVAPFPPLTAWSEVNAWSNVPITDSRYYGNVVKELYLQQNDFSYPVGKDGLEISRVEISKCTPIPYSNKKGAVDSINMYNFTSINPRVTERNLIIPNGTVTAVNQTPITPDLYHSSANGTLGALNYKTSVNFITNETPKAIAINLLQNPIVAHTAANYDKSRIRHEYQYCLASLSGAIIYLYDRVGNVIYAEPIRAFALPSSVFGKDRATGITVKHGGTSYNYPAEAFGNVKAGIFNFLPPVLTPPSMSNYVISGSIGSFTNPVSTSVAPEVTYSLRTVTNTQILPTIGVDGKPTGAFKSPGLPIGGVEVLNLTNAKQDLFGLTFKDTSGREFKLDSNALDIGIHKCVTISKASVFDHTQDFVLGSYTHNYLFPWVSNTKTKYIVLENSNFNSMGQIAMNLQLSRYHSKDQDPSKVDYMQPSEFFLYQRSGKTKHQYINSVHNVGNVKPPAGTTLTVPIPIIADINRNYLSYRNFNINDPNFYKNVPFLGYLEPNQASNWTRDSEQNGGVSGNLNETIVDGPGRYYHSTGSFNVENSQNINISPNTTIIVLREPVYLHSIKWVSRTFTDKNPHFKNNMNISLYNSFSHCISTAVSSDAIVTLENNGSLTGNASMKSHKGDTTTALCTNVLAYTTFSPATPSSQVAGMNVLP